MLILVFTRDLFWLSRVGINPASMNQAFRSVMIEVIFIMGVLFLWIFNMVLTYSKNLRLLFDNETYVLERVSRGDFTRSVPVVTSDEFGVIAGHTNLMMQGLRHRIQLLSALKVAEEVQKNLLPRRPPSFPNLDLAGTSIYCDETGGDYYDFLPLSENRIGIVVADAAGHGIGSALQMTAARGFLISGTKDYHSPVQLLKQINHFLVRDAGDTGRFISMFFVEIDTAAKTLKWIRAGHEPAHLYRIGNDDFMELGGQGMALGVMEEPDLDENLHQGWQSGSVLLVATDGIREARNPAGEMFGLDRLKSIVAGQANQSAERIRNGIIEALEDFQEGFRREDDVTLTIVKLL